MKLHPLLRLSGALYALAGAASLFCVVYFSVFQVLLSEEETPSVNIALLAAYMIIGLVTAFLEIVAGLNGRRGGDLKPCQGMALVAVVCNLTIFTATRCGQLWYPFAAGLALTFLFLYGIQKEVESWDKPVRRKKHG